MLLPLHILETIDYYKYDVSSDYKVDIITLYFKSKWKFPKKIKHTRVSRVSENIISYVSTHSVKELIAQLDNFLDNKNELIYFTKEHYIEILNFTIRHSNSGFNTFNDFINFLESFNPPESESESEFDNVIQFKPKNK